jgi:hypothetical protein
MLHTKGGDVVELRYTTLDTKGDKKPALGGLVGRCWIVLNYSLVPGAGIEPAQPYGREILSLLCLPISPSGQLPNFLFPALETT